MFSSLSCSASEIIEDHHARSITPPAQPARHRVPPAPHSRPLREHLLPLALRDAPGWRLAPQGDESSVNRWELLSASDWPRHSSQPRPRRLPGISTGHKEPGPISTQAGESVTSAASISPDDLWFAANFSGSRVLSRNGRASAQPSWRGLDLLTSSAWCRAARIRSPDPADRLTVIESQGSMLGEPGGFGVRLELGHREAADAHRVPEPPRRPRRSASSRSASSHAEVLRSPAAVTVARSSVLRVAVSTTLKLDSVVTSGAGAAGDGWQQRWRSWPGAAEPAGSRRRRRLRAAGKCSSWVAFLVFRLEARAGEAARQFPCARLRHSDWTRRASAGCEFHGGVSGVWEWMSHSLKDISARLVPPGRVPPCGLILM